jgi:hypothetical protein
MYGNNIMKFTKNLKGGIGIGRGLRKSNGGSEFEQSTLYTCI